MRGMKCTGPDSRSGRRTYAIAARIDRAGALDKELH